MEINFSYTNEIVKNLLEIEKNRQIINKADLKTEDQQYLKDKAIINSAYFGCKLEDENLNHKDFKSKKEVKNYINLLNSFKNHDELYPNLLIIFNNQLTNGIFDEEFTFEADMANMEFLIDNILYNKEYPDVIIIGIAQYVLNRMSPFRHMNGKTINAITSYLLSFKEIDPNQFLDLNEFFYMNKLAYIDLLNYDLTVWLEFFTEILSKSMEHLKKEVISLESDFDLSEKEIMILDYLEENECIQNRHVQEILNISSKTAHSYLDKLLEKNLIEREGKGRSIHYKLKAVV
ncbi:MAG: winged helix-turn-helix transcriptional regulator [Methanobrevibacter sp.]|uniref:Fic family protein n=1 Tax=Methanobrevibacter sp. TaxID=66852 RepID=UPI0026DF6E6B|nr:winged helix-turn-helix transcriptional regulator [Methanobrevibacter sp.]MDO5849469.1 winged helix-turn-helix transcriptional regulator [Methanobrevibacter sp.]